MLLNEMLSMEVDINGDNAWPDLQGREEEIVEITSMLKVAVLDKGMASGRPSVAFRFDLPNGEVALAQTSARLFCSAAKIIMAKYPDLFVD